MSGFASILGGQQHIIEAMKRRGLDASVLQQVSLAGGGMPMPQAAERNVGNVSSTPSRFSTESEIIVKALDNRLKAISKIEGGI